VSDDLAFATALDLAARIRAGEVSPVELTELYLERIERLDPELNSYVTVDADGALASARAPAAGPFSGVPIPIKDLTATAGLRTTYSCKQFADHVPDFDTAVLVLTHDDKFDLPLLEAVLKTDAFYVGALGSRRNQERRRGLLLERGVEEADLERIAGPAGLDIGADAPAETALSMLAEILATRAGRAGGRLKESPHRIHAEPVR